MGIASLLETLGIRDRMIKAFSKLSIYVVSHSLKDLDWQTRKLIGLPKDESPLLCSLCWEPQTPLRLSNIDVVTTFIFAFNNNFRTGTSLYYKIILFLFFKEKYPKEYEKRVYFQSNLSS